MNPREVVTAARRSADAGDVDTAIAGLVTLAKLPPRSLALDVRMRWFETVGALERAGLAPEVVRARLVAGVWS